MFLNSSALQRRCQAFELKFAPAFLLRTKTSSTLGAVCHLLNSIDVPGPVPAVSVFAVGDEVVSDPGLRPLLVPALGHHPGHLGLDPQVDQDPLVLPPLLWAPGLPSWGMQPRVLHCTVRVGSPGNHARSCELPVPRIVLVE